MRVSSEINQQRHFMKLAKLFRFGIPSSSVLLLTGCFMWSSVIQPIAVAQNDSIAVQPQKIQLAQLPDLSRPVEKKIRLPGGSVLTGFRYNPNTMEVGILLSGDHVIKPIIEKQEEQRPKYTDYNRVTIKNFKYRGIDVGKREILVDARSRYQKLEDRPVVGGRYTTFDQAADITLGANFEVKDHQLDVGTYIRQFEPGWASGPLGFVYSAFDAAFGAVTWIAEREFITFSKTTGTLGSVYVNLAQPQKELVNSMFSEVNRWNSEGLVYLNRTDYDSDGIWLLFKADRNQVAKLWPRLGNTVGGYFPGLTVNNQLNLISAPVATSLTGDFIKNGNNGTASCNSFCGAVKGNKVVWGSEYGVCSSARNESTGQLLSCDAVPGLIPDGKQLTCGYNKTAFVKHGNNGTVSCNAFCAGSNWSGGVGRCVAAVNTKNGNVISCDTIPGLLKGPELTCTCGR
jgi:hypothetical protein